MPTFLDFEKPVAELEGKIEELGHLSDDGEINIADGRPVWESNIV